jgi:ABC-type uncharacterized transport system permease subunit
MILNRDLIFRTNYSYIISKAPKEVVKELADCFKINKYQALEENVLYDAMVIYNLLNRPMHIDILFDKFAKDMDRELSVNLERMLYLSITFLFSIGKVVMEDNLISRGKL